MGNKPTTDASELFAALRNVDDELEGCGVAGTWALTGAIELITQLQASIAELTRKAQLYDEACALVGTLGHMNVTNAISALQAKIAALESKVAARPSISDTEAALDLREPFAWATFDGEGSYDLRLYECNESYRDEWIAANGQSYASWVTPLYEAPTPGPVVAVANNAEGITLPIEFLGEYYELLSGVKYTALHTLVRKGVVETIATTHNIQLPTVDAQAVPMVIDAGALGEIRKHLTAIEMIGGGDFTDNMRRHEVAEEIRSLLPGGDNE